ncbi:hypothetical protein [Lysobacter capsici]|uniref:hypothetical protein n=1 Tax=Lysobacter capsici TaxID=435897 RepID=UPI000627D1C8|nr:hypothetical protein [Lysobacter capsici]WND78917.1 hypothetical protein RJ610_16610 [Lysobacter capsici]WND84112.1 hypothetical protein RJ609_16620 [Lysobacter capsici]
MASINMPYAQSNDPAVRRWWSQLSDASKRDLSNSWHRDEREDPLARTARRVAGFLTDHLRERAREERCWESQDLYEHLVAHEIEPLRDFIPVFSPWWILDHGMLWPVDVQGNGQLGISVNSCSLEQQALLAMRDRSE